MNKEYNVFYNDLVSIPIIEVELKILERSIKKSKPFELKKKKNLRRQIQRRVSTLNNHKLNLIKKLPHIRLEELIKILQETEGLSVQAYSCDVPGKEQPIELIVLIDESEDNLRFARIYDTYYSNNAPASSKSKIFDVYQRLENSEIEPSNLKYISKGSIVKKLMYYDDDVLFDRFLKSYMNYLNTVMEV